MNKYQKFLIEKYRDRYYRLFSLNNEKISNEKFSVSDELVVTQNDDITITNYVLYISNDSLENIFAIKGTKETKISKEIPTNFSLLQNNNLNGFFIPINFEDKIDTLKIVFKNNLAEDLYLPVSYVLADKENYYAKKEKEQKEFFSKKANISYATGINLINIYFQPCADSYSYSEIILYCKNMMLGKFKVDEDMFFKPITDLATGNYEFVLKQYDVNGSLLFESDKIKVELRFYY